MKPSLSEFLRKCQFSLVLALGTLPVTLVVLILARQDLTYFAWLLPTVYCLLSFASLLVTGKWRFWIGLAFSGILIFWGGALTYQMGIRLPLIFSICYAFLLMAGMLFGGWEWHRELPPFCYWTGVVLHVIAQILILVVRYYGSTKLDPIVPGLTAAFFALALLILLAMNRKAMSEASLRRQKASGSMRWKNLLLLGGFFAAALGISLIPSLWSMLQRIWNWLMAFIASLQLPQGTTEAETMPPETDPIAPSIKDEKEPDPTAIMLQELFMRLINALFIPVMIVACIIVGFLLLRFFIKVLRKLFAAITRYANATSSDYEDEVTSIREEENRPGFITRLKQFNLVDERKLSPLERIRHRYKRLMKKNPQWGKGSTARENLPIEAAVLYEQARYTEKPLSEEDAKAFIEGIKDVKPKK